MLPYAAADTFMNNGQRVIVAIGATLLALNALFPRRQEVGGPATDRTFLLSPTWAKRYVREHPFVPVQVDLGMLVAGSVQGRGAHATTKKLGGATMPR